MKEYNDLCIDMSTLVTQRYSTSFTHGIKTLHKRFHKPIYSIYGFVRLADEIVDTFHGFNKKELLNKFRDDTWHALDSGVSTNPILNAFQLVANRYNISRDLIEAFLNSMELDLEKKNYNDAFYNKYIFGSAEVVGLMCLKVFCEDDDKLYERLQPPAQRLGAAFQKVNFLRDMKSDFEERGRVYFPGVDFSSFTNHDKMKIEEDIDNDFKAAYPGVMQLPEDARPGVYTAFIYYRELFHKIKKVPASQVKSVRIRIPGREKLMLLMRTYSRFGFSAF